ncbi:MAG: hypothetical protein V4621_04410 [Pseudomonadota bacterium]
MNQKSSSHSAPDDYMSSAAVLPRAGKVMGTLFLAGIFGGGIYAVHSTQTPALDCKGQFRAQAAAEHIDPTLADNIDISPRSLGSEQATCEAFLYGHADASFIEWNAATGYSYVERRPQRNAAPATL